MTLDEYEKAMRDMAIDHEIELARLRRSGSLPEYADPLAGFGAAYPNRVKQINDANKEAIESNERIDHAT